MYCGSVYGSLCSLLANVTSESLQGKRIGMFSYGSVLPAPCSFKVKGSIEEIQKQLDIQHDWSLDGPSRRRYMMR